MNEWEKIAEKRSSIADGKDDFNFHLGKFDPYLIGFLLLVGTLSIAAILAVTGAK